MAFTRCFVYSLSALVALLCISYSAADTSCEFDEVAEEMRMASERGSQWLQDKREEANSAATKASSLLQTAARTQQKVLNTFAPNGELVQRTIGTFKVGDAKTQKKKKADYQKPTFNPFMPNSAP